jgi:hypothetical protein
VLGTGGDEQVSGPELAARLGLDSTWEYFSVSHAGKLTREPDASGQTAPPSSPVVEAPPATQPPPGTPQGGAPAPASALAAGTGGVLAG